MATGYPHSMVEDVPKHIQETARKIDSKLECSFCLEYCKEPKLLPCFHVFCKSPCLEELAAQDIEEKTLTCPTCRHLVTLPESGVAGLQTDYHTEHLFEIRKLLEKVLRTDPTCENCGVKSDSIHHCLECKQYLCGSCIQVHNNWKLFQSHKVFNMDEVRANPELLIPPTKCGVHADRDASVYCQTCSTIICPECSTMGAHKGHDFGMVVSLLPLAKDELALSIQPLKEQLAEVEYALKAFVDREKEITTQKAEFRESIERKFTELMELLTKQRKKLIENLDYHTHLKVHDLAVQKENVEYTYSKLRSCLEYVDQGIADGHEVNVLRMKTPILEAVKQLTADYDPDSIQPEAIADLEHLIDITQLEQTCQKFDQLVMEQMVYVKNCYAIGDGSKFAIAGKRAILEVHAKTQDKENCTHRLNLTAELVNNQTREVTECEIWHRKNGECKVSYMPPRRGKHHLHLKIDEKHIQGSPYLIVVAPSPECFKAPVIVARNVVNRPHRAVVNSKGYIIVGDYKECEVVVLTPNGKIDFKFGETGTREGQFKQPCGVAVDRDDNMYVADNDNNRIQKYNPDGRFIKSVGGVQGSGELEFYFPLGICFNEADGNLYVCDQRNHRIQVITTDLEHVRFFGERGEEEGQLQNPRYATFDDANNLYVTDYTNNRVQVFTTEGQFLRTISQKIGEDTLLEPYAIGIDSGNVVYISELSRNCINMFTPEGDLIGSFGVKGSGEGEFDRIRGLYVGGDEFLIVSEPGNSRLQVFDLNKS